jgi:DNA-binding NtrC family response regulator
MSGAATLIGDSRPMRRLRELIATVAPTRIPVLIEGETGTGKELVAAALHAQSRRDGAFVAFNVCALGDSMFEDSLFGHVRGAYTGAVGESLGFLREANGGTVFLDEISGLPLVLQAKLLRAVETGVFRPIGSARDARSDFRPIAATNERLDGLVDVGRFRADLAHRLSGIVLAVPNLAERVDDIPMLVRHFALVARSMGGVKNVGVAPEVERALQSRPWPGNVRELRQVVEAAMVFARDTLDLGALEVATAHRSRGNAPGTIDRLAAERERMTALLDGVRWNTDQLARELGVHRATVYRRAKRLGIRLPSGTRLNSWPVDRDSQIFARLCATDARIDTIRQHQ